MTPSMVQAFSALEAHRTTIANAPMRQRFDEDPERFKKFSVAIGDLLLDYSKNLIDETTIEKLVHLAKVAEVEEQRTAMFAGEPINKTENRSVLHVALRAGPDEVFRVGDENVMPEIQATLARMAAFSESVRSGTISGTAGKFTDIVNIGIGGSDLGPAMATAALHAFHDGPRVHFVANVDGSHLRDTLAGLAAGRTLFLVASKTFTTIETMTNAGTARAWLVEALGEGAVGVHFAAMSSANDKVAEFGITAERTFGFWDWVGGRTSIWSAIGLSLMMAIGAENFRKFLAGGQIMDDHFRSAPLDRNMPVLLALLGVWYRNVWGFPVYAVIPYDQRLSRFPAYLQQLDMESNGKRVRMNGATVMGATGPIVFGESGTNSQHAFFQHFHQSAQIVPCDFLVAARSDLDEDPHHDLLLANCLAQSEALMRGKTIAEARSELRNEWGRTTSEVELLAPHKVFPGNRPSNTILYRRLDPSTLGMLIALYEHKVFVQGVIWGVNSFDQWGVEFGKTLAGELLPLIEGREPLAGHDSSTLSLIEAVNYFRQF